MNTKIQELEKEIAAYDERIANRIKLRNDSVFFVDVHKVHNLILADLEQCRAEAITELAELNR